MKFDMSDQILFYILIHITTSSSPINPDWVEIVLLNAAKMYYNLRERLF